MKTIVWTIQALDDVEAIRDFIKRDSEHYANLTVARIFTTVQRVSQFPESGRVVPELANEQIREIIMGSYRIVYRVADEAVEVATVFHSARLPELRHFDP